MSDSINDKIESKLAEKKGATDKPVAWAGILIPVVVAFVGIYFTERYNRNQLDIQSSNNDNQLQVANINAGVGQSQLIKAFMDNLKSKDTSERNIAITAILYAAPIPGKKIVDIIARSGTPSEKHAAVSALGDKRVGLVSDLFSPYKPARVSAANEILSGWVTDAMLTGIIAKANNCLDNKDLAADSANGVFNAFIVMNSFTTDLLKKHRIEITALAGKVPADEAKTKAQSDILLSKLN